jgi:hypothetical protein
MQTDISILIHTFNGYNWLWRGCIDGWRANYTPSVPMYWGTDIESPDDKDLKPFKVIYSGVGNWSARLVRLLAKIDTKYVLYAQEDHWPVKSVPDLAKMMAFVRENDLKRLQLSGITRYYKVKKSHNISYFEPKSKYLVSHQPSIWDREFMIEQMKYDETPWINEYEGTKRLNNTDIHGKIAIYDYNWHHHACKGGVFVPLQP